MAESFGKISVIVPVYNVDSYLDRCVNSIVEQTYGNIEVILVDDGSTDKCPIMCDAWKSRDKRIKVIHKENGGLSDARNVGIDASTGDYLLLVDSDDYIESTMCEKLLIAVKNAQADIAVCNLYREYPDYNELDTMKQTNNQVVEREKILEEFFMRSSIAMVVAWNKLYRRELFFTKEHIRYPKGRLHEDEFTSYKLLYAAKKTVFLTEPLYHYVQRDGSIMSRYSERNMRDIAACALEYLQWSDKYAPQKRPLFEYAAVNIFWMLMGKCEEFPNLSEQKKEVVRFGKILGERLRDYYNNPYHGTRDKLRFYAFEWGMYETLYKIVWWLRTR